MLEGVVTVTHHNGKRYWVYAFSGLDGLVRELRERYAGTETRVAVTGSRAVDDSGGSSL